MPVPTAYITVRTITLAPAQKAALIYALFGFIVGALTQAMQLLLVFSLNPVTDIGRWAISAAAGILSAGIAYALPYLKAVLPDTTTSRNRKVPVDKIEPGDPTVP